MGEIRFPLDIGQAGEHRKVARTICMEVTLDVVVNWPEGIPFTEERCKEIAAGVAPQRYEVDVGPIGKIVWAEVLTDCSDSAVEIIENVENETAGVTGGE